MPEPNAVMMPGVASVVLLAAALAGCTSARRVQPAEFIPKFAPDVVWVTYADKSVVAVAAPEVAGDTLKGKRHGSEERLAIPLDDVRSVEAKLPDHTKTMLLLTAAGAAAVASVYVLWIAQAGPRTGGVMC